MIKMKDINFGWPLLYGLSFFVLSVSVLVKMIVWSFQDGMDWSRSGWMFLIMIVLAAIGWILVKIAYANKENDEHQS